MFVDVDPDQLPTDVASTDKLRSLSAADRQKQRGASACAAVLRSLLQGGTWSADSGLLVVDWHAGVANDWLRAVRLLQDEKLGEDLAGVHLWGLAFCETREETMFVRSRLHEECYNIWYNNTLALPDVGRVGPRDLPSSEHPPDVLKPDLKVGFIAPGAHGKDILVLPEAIDQKFTGNDELQRRWAAFRENHVAKFGRPADPTSAPTILRSGERSDFSYRPPAAPQLLVGSENIRKASDIEGSRLFSFKVTTASRKFPLHVCQQDGVYTLWVDGTEFDKDVKLLPFEMVLMGFGLGRWGEARPEAPVPADALKFECSDDTVYLTVKHNDSSKKTARLCEHLEELKGLGKEGLLAYHKLAPLVHQATNKMVQGRYEVNCVKMTHFTPKALELEARPAEQDRVLLASEAGGFWAPNQLKNLPCEAATVIFDCVLVPGTVAARATIRPSLPKLVLTQELTVRKGTVVRIP